MDGRSHSVAPRLLILALGSLAAFAQQSTVIGTIDKFVGNEIQVKTPSKVVTLLIGDGTVVSKGKTYQGSSPLKAGDEISARCERNGTGKLAAVRIWASVVTFSATVKYIDGDDIEVMTSSTSDSHREERKIVHLHPDTAFGTNRKDITVGQYVRVVGLDVENGAIDAARVTIYNTDTPAKR
jgi:hypothetical protein